MASLHLIMDYSQTAYWLYASLHALKDELAKQGFDFAPLDLDAPGALKTSGYSLWLIGDDPASPRSEKVLAAIQHSLDSGRDVIFMGMTADKAKLAGFLGALAGRFGGAHAIKPVFRCGNPALMFDRWHRATAPKDRQALSPSILANACGMSGLVELAAGLPGLEPPQLLAENSAGLSREATALAMRDVMRAIGAEAKAEPCPPIADARFASSETGKRLVEARRIRHNDWPRLDDSAYMEALLRVEAAIPLESSAPLEQRKEFAAKSGAERAALIQLFRPEAGAFDLPPWFESQPQADPDAPLAPGLLSQFVKELPSECRSVLIERFDNDRLFLTGDQKALERAIRREPEFSSIGVAEEQPLLTVLTMTRNHERFIGQCIESVLAQRASFPIRHLVLDHYSEDATPAIINKYASEYPTVRPVLLSGYDRIYNNVHDLFVRCRSEYAALCDGDDYFTDPCKLQKQVDFLRANKDCSICFHPVLVHFEDGSRSDFFYPPADTLPRGGRGRFYLADLLNGNLIQTNSAVYRWRFRDGLPDWFDARLCPGDWYWHMLHAEQGKIGFLRDVMSVYRRHAGAAYCHAFKDLAEHRRSTGMGELHAYEVINRHFNGRYKRRLEELAAGVFNGYMEIYLKEGSSALLDEACEKHPEFAKYYLSIVKEDLSQKRSGGMTR